jgi:hypothetical protein
MGGSARRVGTGWLIWSVGWVEATFETIRKANASDGLDDVRVAFDPVLGFPTLIEWIPDRGLLDAGGSLSMRDPRPLP